MPAPHVPQHRVIVHLDMDAFYASIEQRDQPALMGRPVVVGAAPDRRGVICAASYEARRFGVHAAMPSRTAARLCPDAVFVRPRMEHYRAESRAIMDIVASTGAVIQQVSVDEAYLDLGGIVGHGPGDGDDALMRALPIARVLQSAILQHRHLSASIGIASNKLLAKLASDFQKPRGLTLVPDRDKVAFLRPLPVRALHGVGQVTSKVLEGAGLHTVGDLQDHPGDLRPLVGSWGATLRRFAFGIDDRPLDLDDDVKSISSENTFEQDTDDRPTLRRCLREQADEVAAKLERRRLSAGTIQVKVRYGAFTTLTRQWSRQEPVFESADIYRIGCWLLGRHRLVHRPLRLLGLGVSSLREAPLRQLRWW